MTMYSCSNRFMAAKHKYLCLTFFGRPLFCCLTQFTMTNIKDTVGLTVVSYTALNQISTVTYGHQGVFQISPTRDVVQQVFCPTG